MVIFRDCKEAEKASTAIGRTLVTLRVKPEFKFNKCADPVRDAFFRAVAPFDFKVRALVIDKGRIYSSNLREDTDRFYNYFVQLLIKHDSGVLQAANIKIDGSGDREFKQKLAGYLRKQLGTGKVVKVRFADSHRDYLVQLADMTAGAIARS